MVKNLSCVSCGSLKRFPHTTGSVLEVIHIISTLALNLSNGFSYYLSSKNMRPFLLNKLYSKSIVNGLWSFVMISK